MSVISGLDTGVGSRPECAADQCTMINRDDEATADVFRKQRPPKFTATSTNDGFRGNRDARTHRGASQCTRLATIPARLRHTAALEEI